MIYSIKNGRLVKSVAKNGKRFNHQTKNDKHKNTLESKRSHRFSSFYNSTRWHNLSLAIRRREPLCRQCVRECKAGKRSVPNLATSVDHIQPIKTKDGYRHRWDPRNLQPLCHYHHQLKDKRGL